LSSHKKHGNIFIISAPSGCGKTTVVARVLDELNGVVRSVSATTRKPRGSEKNGLDYIFLTEKSFKSMVAKGAFLEWAQTFGYYYGTPCGHVSRELKKGRDVILTIDVKGAAQVKKKAKDSVSVFLLPPDEKTLRKRLLKRDTDGPGEIKKRIDLARHEMRQAVKYDYVIVNDDLDDAVGKLAAIIIAKRCQVK